MDSAIRSRMLGLQLMKVVDLVVLTAAVDAQRVELAFAARRYQVQIKRLLRKSVTCSDLRPEAERQAVHPWDDSLRPRSNWAIPHH
jgi:hypothetical protein